MSYLVCHFEKYKSGNIHGIQKHNQRENNNYSNIDIDKSKTPLNYDLINSRKINYTDKANFVITAKRDSKRAIRKDAVVYCECIISSDGDFFKNLSSEAQEKFFKDSLKYLEKKLKDPALIISANVHLDETTPHMHVGFVPIIDKSLSAKKLINRNFLKEIQSELPKLLKNNGFDIERGLEGNKNSHVETKEFKSKLNKQVMNLKNELDKLNKEFDKKTNDFNNMTKTLEKNSLVMSEIKEINVEPIMFSSKVKINKDDFINLQDSALKAYSQHNLYATVLTKLEKLEKSNEDLKIESENNFLKLCEERKLKDNEIYNLKRKIENLRKDHMEQDKKYENEIAYLEHRILKFKEFFQKNSLAKSLYDEYRENESNKMINKIKDYLKEVKEVNKKEVNKVSSNKKNKDKNFEIDL